MKPVVENQRICRSCGQSKPLHTMYRIPMDGRSLHGKTENSNKSMRILCQSCRDKWIERSNSAIGGAEYEWAETVKEGMKGK